MQEDCVSLYYRRRNEGETPEYTDLKGYRLANAKRKTTLTTTSIETQHRKKVFSDGDITIFFKY